MGGWTSFDTPIGACGIAWSDRGITGVRLPPGRYPGRPERPPVDVRAVIDRILAVLRGGHDDLVSVELDLDAVGSFEAAVYEAARSVPSGATTTYGEVARQIGQPAAAREVGQALGRNPVPIVVPCHRVVAAGGKLGGFSAPGGTATKTRLLAIEGSTTPTLPFG